MCRALNENPLPRLSLWQLLLPFFLLLFHHLLEVYLRIGQYLDVIVRIAQLPEVDDTVDAVAVDAVKRLRLGDKVVAAEIDGLPAGNGVLGDGSRVLRSEGSQC